MVCGAERLLPRMASCVAGEDLETNYTLYRYQPREMGVTLSDRFSRSTVPKFFNRGPAVRSVILTTLTRFFASAVRCRSLRTIARRARGETR